MAVVQDISKPVHMEKQDLAGKVAIVTGGTTGIGRATAFLLAERGVKVVIYGRHEQPLRDAMSDLEKSGGEFFGLTADNAYEDQILKVFEETRQRFGDIDILINNAALAARSTLDMTYDEALYVLRTNILGYLTCMDQAVEMMKRKGGGHIVNIGSLSAKEREAGSDVYVATKGAVQAMNESFRKRMEQKHPEIRVSLIEPGNVGTNLSSETPDVEKQRKQEEEWKSLKAEDIAAAILYILEQHPRNNVLELRLAPVKQGL